MEYYQLTIDDWLSMKAKLQAELLGVRKSFVRIGYILRKIEESKGYENDGYKSISEWAKGEYGLEGSTVSRFISINKEYSIGGFSEQLLPEYEDFKRSQLEEMLKLPAPDREMITPDTARADIRELKQFNKQAPVTGVADDIHEMVKHFFENSKDILVKIYENFGKINAMKDIVNPSGSRSFRKGLYFLMMHEDKVMLKKHGGIPETYSWEHFFEIVKDVYGEELEKGIPAAEIEEENGNESGMEHGNENNIGEDVGPGARDSEEIIGDSDQEFERDDSGDNKKIIGSGGKSERTDGNGAESSEIIEKSVKETVKEDGIEEDESSDRDEACSGEPEKALQDEFKEENEIAPAQNNGLNTEQKSVLDEVKKEIKIQRKVYMEKLSVQGLADYLNRELSTMILKDKKKLKEWLQEKVGNLSGR